MQAGTAYRRGSAKMERRRWLRELTPLPVAHRDLLRVTLQAAFAGFWLGNLDSNQDKQSQSLLCYRYTIPHRSN